MMKLAAERGAAMRDVPGRQVPVNGRTVYAEESGQGQHQVVFEAGGGCGRTCWDPVLPFLAGSARLVAYDRAGRARSGPAAGPLSVDDMAADLVAMTEAIVPGEFVLVAHSMGGLVARRAAGRLGTRLRGLLLADTLPETSPVYDTWDQTARNIDRMLAVTQPLSRLRPLARLFSGNLRRLYPAGTYQAMLAEDFTPAGIGQTRREMQAVAAAVPQFRAQPPRLPDCPTTVLSAARADRGRERQVAANREHQRRYADRLPDGRYEVVDSAHLIQAGQPQLLAARIQELCRAAA
jgi:pimeloyl-ACP methyl ester carboxylesterase